MPELQAAGTAALGEGWHDTANHAQESEVVSKARQARAAAKRMAIASTAQKDAALRAMADMLLERQSEILAANEQDLARAKENGVRGALLERLTLTPSRIAAMADGLREIALLPDPVGRSEGAWRRPNGIEISRVRVPLGVVGIIYESRPNVTADAAGLCLKAGNAVVLRGGSEAIRSNQTIAHALANALAASGLPRGALQLITSTDRAAAREMMRLSGLIDVLIPRGGAGLIRSVMENATVPVIETGSGNVHVFVDASANLDMAQEIVVNAKVQRPSVCNAMETLLVHQSIASTFLPKVAQELVAKGVELRGCPATCGVLSGVVPVKPATEEDWETEYLDLILAIRVVADLDAALQHIDRYSTLHSEAIVTNDYANARRFVNEVDAAAVYVNASTRFTDGQQFGFGAEIGISTQKLHARGPMGLNELTSTKYVVHGQGQVRT